MGAVVGGILVGLLENLGVGLAPQGCGRFPGRLRLRRSCCWCCSCGRRGCWAGSGRRGSEGLTPQGSVPDRHSTVSSGDRPLRGHSPPSYHESSPTPQLAAPGPRPAHPGTAALTRSPYHLSIGVFIGLHAMVALGLGLLLGYAGQVSLGHAAFYGLGAYGSAILTLRYALEPLAGPPRRGAHHGLSGLPHRPARPSSCTATTWPWPRSGFGIIVRILFNEGGRLHRRPLRSAGHP